MAYSLPPYQQSRPQPPIPRPRRRRLADWPVIGYVVAPWSLLSDLRAAQLRLRNRVNALEARMTASMDEQEARGQQLVALIKAEFESLRSQLAAEEADDQTQVDAAVTDARSKDAERVGRLLDTLAQVLPGTPQEVPVPDPGEPATLPDDGDPADGPTTSEDVIADPSVLDPSNPGVVG